MLLPFSATPSFPHAARDNWRSAVSGAMGSITRYASGLQERAAAVFVSGEPLAGRNVAVSGCVRITGRVAGGITACTSLIARPVVAAVERCFAGRVQPEAAQASSHAWRHRLDRRLEQLQDDLARQSLKLVQHERTLASLTMLRASPEGEDRRSGIDIGDSEQIDTMISDLKVQIMTIKYRIDALNLEIDDTERERRQPTSAAPLHQEAGSLFVRTSEDLADWYGQDARIPGPVLRDADLADRLTLDLELPAPMPGSSIRSWQLSHVASPVEHMAIDENDFLLIIAPPIDDEPW